jgi:hypothetical protein
LFQNKCAVFIGMNELINIIVQKTGISQEHAQKAAQAAIEFIKGKLPAPIASQLDAVLAGDMSGLAGQADEMLKGKMGGAFSPGRS